MEKWQIVHRTDHYELYIDGKFYCSADTFQEALEDLEVYRLQTKETIFHYHVNELKAKEKQTC